MVQQILGKRDIGGGIGNAIGEGFGNSFSEAAQEEFQYNRNRSRLQEAFGQLEGLADDPAISKNPYKMLSKLGQAFAGIPGGQQVVSEIFPKLLQRAQRGDIYKDTVGEAPGEEIPGQGNAAEGSGDGVVKNNKVTDEGTQNNEQFVGQREGHVAPSLQQQVKTAMGGFTDQAKGNGTGPLQNASYGQGPVPNTMSPERMQQLTEWAHKNFEPEIANQYIENLKQGNANQRAAVEDKYTAWKRANEMSQETMRRQGERRAFADERLPGDLTPEDKAIFMKLGDNNASARSLDEWYRMTKNTYDRFEKARDNVYNDVNGDLKRSWLQGNRTRDIKNLRLSVKPLLDMGMQGEATRLLSEAGYGQGEIENIINPLNQRETELLNNLPKYKHLDEEIKATPDTPEYEKQYEKAAKNQEKIRDRYVDYIIKNFKTGSEEKPGTSLLGLRDKFSEKNIDWREFQDLLVQAQEKGDLKFDSHQLTQLGKLRNRPEQSLWDIINPFGGKH
jgi:hypothetical protein